MKYIFLVAITIFLTATSAFSQKVPYNVVFDITNNEPAIQQRMIVLVKEIVSADPDAKVEVVFYGNSISIIDKNKSTVMDDISKLAENKQVQFRACAIAMKKHNVDETQLVSGVQSVPDGIYEIVKKQAAGYGYIKIVQ
ncbi:MAG TPA: DsrE family protein [Ginsengibacter sp.]|nr:DsrE family protein [Ginsengibacter sp.]